MENEGSAVTDAMRSRLADLKVIGLVVSITLALAGASWSFVSWATTRVSETEARKAHDDLAALMETREHAAEQIQAVHKRVSGIEDRTVTQHAELKQTLEKVRDQTWQILREVRGP